MALEKILDIQIIGRDWLGVGDNIKVHILVHCSCGKDYLLKEKFPASTTLSIQNHVKPTTCPDCKDVSYVEHVNKVYRSDYATYSPRIVTTQVLSKQS